MNKYKLIKPIFLNSFARGGSNMIWQLFQSHDDVFSPVYETDKLIYREWGKSRTMRNMYHTAKGGYFLPSIEKVSGSFFFNYGLYSSKNFTERKLNSFSAEYFDSVLYHWMEKNRIKEGTNTNNPDQGSNLHAVKPRLVAKHVNGLLFLTPSLMEMYPDATFLGLVRNGLALYESRLRRQTFKNVEKFSLVYKRIVETMLEYESQYDNFKLLRFEDFLTDPEHFIKDIYQFAGLKYKTGMKIMLKDKAHLNKTGEHISNRQENEKFPVDVSEIFDFVNRDINEIQIKNLPPEQVSTFLSISEGVMKRLGYI